MKLRPCPLLSLLIAVSLLVQGAPLPAAAWTEPEPAEPAAPTAFCDVVTEIPKTECEALVALYNSTSGPNWEHKTGWLTTITPCSWYGMTCNAGHVTRIELRFNWLKGTLPREVTGLTNLEFLELGHNQLNGSIPTWLSGLSSLKYLNLGGNQLSGAIPPQLGTMDGLAQLALSDNQLSGTIPPQLGDMSSLHILYLGGNQLNGSIPPELGNPSHLFMLGLSENRLEGSIPFELTHLKELVDLYLFSNQLSGSVPQGLCDLPNVRSPWVGYNKLTEVPECIVAKDSPGRAQTQTVAPTNLTVTQSGANVQLTWTPILYTADGGYYEVSYATSPGGAYTVHGTTTDKTASGYLVTGLRPGTTYYFRVRAYTPPHRTSYGPDNYQRNALWSDYTRPAAIALGLSVSHIEITQATQDENNNVLLIAGKPTFVRVYLDCGEGCSAMPGVTGVLEVSGPAGGAALNPISQPITAFHPTSWTTQRSDLGKTLNFTLPAEWLTGTITVTAEAAGAIRSEVVTFRPAQSLNTIYVPIRYRGQEPDSTRVRNGAFWAARIYPASKINYVAGTTFDWNACLEDSILCPFRDLNTRNLLNELTTRYRLVNAYVYGWLPAGTFGGGISDPTWGGGVGKAAFGDDHPSEGPRVFAHEVGHLLGRRHTNSNSCHPENMDPQSDWPYPDSLIQEYGLDGYGFGWLVSSSSAIVNPADTYDYMSYCGSLAKGAVWTSPWTYQHIYDEALKPAVVSQTLGQTSAPETYFIASGLVFTNSTATLNPAWVITATVTPSNPPVGTAYCLEGQNAASTALVSRCFDLTFQNYETSKATNVDGFNLMLPYPSDVARIVLKKGATELAVQPVSASAPVVDVLSPNGGESWAASGTYTVTWAASDLDGDPLTYSVLYSPDGNNWVPVGSAITSTQLAVNAAELAGGTAARVRVMATDGVNTSTDASDAAFTVGRKGPQASILAPETAVHFMPGTPLWLQGYGYDLEDGTLEEAALYWRSDRDGELGKGSQVLVTLSPGQHTITLTATDADGNIATASVSMYAGRKTYLPLSLRGR